MTTARSTELSTHEAIRVLQQDLRRDTPMPRYAKIDATLRELIDDGSLRAGLVLPPTASISRLLITSEGTVRKALRRLVDHGYLDPRTTSGHRIRPHPAKNAQPAQADETPQLTTQAETDQAVSH